MLTWAFSIPLFTAAVAWVPVGFGALIKEDYWEMRGIFVWGMPDFAVRENNVF